MQYFTLILGIGLVAYIVYRTYTIINKNSTH